MGEQFMYVPVANSSGRNSLGTFVVLSIVFALGSLIIFSNQSDLEDKLKIADARAAEAEALVETIKAEKAAVEAENVSLKENNTNLVTENQTLKTENDNKTAESLDKDAEINNLRGQFAELQEINQKNQEKIASLETELTNKDVKIQEYATDNEKLNKRVAELEGHSQVAGDEVIIPITGDNIDENLKKLPNFLTDLENENLKGILILFEGVGLVVIVGIVAVGLRSKKYKR